MIELEELKKIQLDILDNVADFCEKNNINYWLDCGTLLGAVRHQGYIPWDDDIDIGMLRPDYDKFMQLYNLSNDRYKFLCVENSKSFNYPYGKVLDLDTVLYEPDKKHGNKISVNIDVFVYDNAPDEQKKIKKMFKKRDFYTTMNIGKTAPYSKKKKRFFKNLLRIPCYYVLKIFPKTYFSKKIINNSKKYSNEETKFVGNFTSVKRIIADKIIFEKLIKLKFEGKEYNAPVGYDKWLTEFYGDYMKLPPKEKQVSHHVFEAYKKGEE